MKSVRNIVCAIIVMAMCASPAAAERIKDITQIKGIRGNPLQGFGIVVGLDGTGDGSDITNQALANLMRQEGLTLTPTQCGSKNIAAVMVRTELPPFAHKGANLTINVSCIGGASSLQGGTLLMTTLRGIDNEVYAIAQGEVVIGGFSSGDAQASVKKNITTVGSIPNGAIVEREEIATFVENGEITLQLLNPDFATAEAIAKSVNTVYPSIAHAADAGNVRIKVPSDVKKTEISSFVNKITLLEAQVDTPAVIVINEKTGTIVVGSNVKISTTAITHGNLSVVVKVTEKVVQPLPFSQTGRTETERNADTKVVEEKRTLMVVPNQPTISELARALNAMGVTPRDLISIFRALEQAGALQAKLKVM